ncbi:hypothetical protein D3C80_2142200 [compost metagenome]
MISPVVASTVAMPASLLDQLPPVTLELNVVVPDTQIACPPDKVPALGGVVTVTVLIAVASEHPPVPNTV